VQAERDTTAVVVVAVAGLVPVAVGRAAVPRIVVPGTATNNAVIRPCPTMQVMKFRHGEKDRALATRKIYIITYVIM
jgi:hypothetical protein